MAPYAYSPIKDWQIRLLKLYPGQGCDELKGEVRVADFFPDVGAVLHNEEERVEYHALSYAWGQGAFSESFHIKESELAISTMLKGALQALRDDREQRFVWADAICINQEDDAEKSNQVRKMFQIYRKASRTMAYLGPEGENTALALAYLIASRAGVPCEDGDVESLRLILPALNDLYTRAWIRRVWVQQEVMASRDLHIRAGDCEISFVDFREGLEALAKLLEDQRVSFDVTESLQQSSLALQRMHVSTEHMISELEFRRTDPHGHHLCECVTHSQQVQATVFSIGSNPECVLSTVGTLTASNPRDYVYGLLGTMNCPIRHTARILDEADQNSALCISVDYSKPTRVVFQDLTKYIIDRDGDLKVLEEHAPHNAVIDDLELPTWCPDWRGYQHISPQRQNNPLISYRRRDYCIPFKAEQQSSHPEGRLCIKGVPLVKVSTVARSIVDGDMDVKINHSLAKPPVRNPHDLDRECTLACFPGSGSCIAVGDLLVAPHDVDHMFRTLRKEVRFNTWQSMLVLRKRQGDNFAFVALAKVDCKTAFVEKDGFPNAISALARLEKWAMENCQSFVIT